MLVLIWQPCISGRRSTGMEHVTTQCHLHAILLFILATSENFSVPATTASITLITMSWSWTACTQHHVNPGELNWTELKGHRQLWLLLQMYAGKSVTTTVYGPVSTILHIPFVFHSHFPFWNTCLQMLTAGCQGCLQHKCNVTGKQQHIFSSCNAPWCTPAVKYFQWP